MTQSGSPPDDTGGHLIDSISINVPLGNAQPNGLDDATQDAVTALHNGARFCVHNCAEGKCWDSGCANSSRDDLCEHDQIKGQCMRRGCRDGATPAAPDGRSLIAQDREEVPMPRHAKYFRDKALAESQGKALADEEEQARREIRLVPASSYTKRRPAWMLDKRIPANDLTLIVGRGGVGKSTILALLCAYRTNGVPILGETCAQSGDVIYCHCEDSVEETLLPRFEAAGADIDRIHLVKVQTPDGGDGLLRLPQDIDKLMELAKRCGALDIHYDPLSAFVFSAKGGRNDADAMRAAYLQIEAAHERNRITGLGLGHCRKALSDSLLDAFMGSSEQGNVIRSAFGAIADPDVKGRFIFSQEKHNRAPQQPSYAYRIEGVTVDGIDTSRIVFTEPTAETASDVLRAQSQWAKRDARRFIINHLAQWGPCLVSSDVVKAGTDLGHNKATLYRAADDLLEFGKIRATPVIVDGRKHTWQLVLDPKIY